MKKVFLILLFIIIFSGLVHAIQTESEKFTIGQNPSLPNPKSITGSYIDICLNIDYRKLNLTNQQKKRIYALRMKLKKEEIQIKAQIDLKNIELQQKLIAPAFNPDEIKKLLEERSKLISELHRVIVEYFLDVKATLTSQQLINLLPSAVNFSCF